MTWEQLYDSFGAKDFIYFISSAELQEMLFPVKLVFIFFTIFLFVAVVYFMTNSSYLKYKFVEDVSEFFSWRSYGQKEMYKRLNKIKKRLQSDSEAEYKLAIIEADDFLNEVLEEREVQGATFEEIVKNTGKVDLPNPQEILQAHEIRNSIVYDPDYKISQDQATKVLTVYENAINTISSN